MTHTKDEALALALEALKFCRDNENYGHTSTLEAIAAIKQALAAQPAPVPLTEMAQILGDRLAKEQAVYLSMETAKSFVKSMLNHGITEKGQS